MILPSDLIRRIHNIDEILAFVFGFIGNVSTILLAINLKSTIAVVYRKILIQLTVIDLLFSFMTLIIQPITIIVEGSQYFIQNGPLRHIAQPWNHYLNMVWLMIFYFSFCSACVQYIFRYLIICRGYEISTLRYQLLFLFPLCISGGFFFFFVKGYYPEPQSCSDIKIQELAELLVEDNCSNTFLLTRLKSTNPLAKYLALIGLLIVAANYSIIIFCTFKIQRYLKFAELSTQTRELHREMTRAMLVQATSPLLVSMGPTLYAGYCIIFAQTAIDSMIITSMCIAWLPAINSFSTMLLIKCFRRKIFSCTISSKIRGIITNSTLPSH